MKKYGILILIGLLLTGCAAQETFETVADELVQSVMAQPRQIAVNLPDDAVAPVLESDSEQVYLCKDYEILIEIVDSGDLSGTIQKVSGYAKDKLTVVETEADGVKRYEFVWASAGENGERLGQGVILDDGSYHYVLTVLRDVEAMEDTQVVWSDLFQSFRLI